ncbi:GDP-mannose:cellobiosyl-diphosphopolyprenol alpha-mannosyltransferase [Lacunisphaera limnophila]|uniref:GDP-mannose:cellobiosyl-diphosphopolyprenol alpha-mannosyltransferase n=1 Tax=Lacunisphaera limnophila TaxID=1838286 RepID=A0A1D8AXX8_9BACT|nr:glycosyltransferase [Lacunisphaera limnophila]AOS45731.1 GDP-mannose:cellobiosyl-diphosphopolyprenol alpha-mannosyltransferase [Lacunisphaera limnophila]
MRFCHIVPSLEERHGGPSKSVRAIADAQAALGADVDLLATQPPPATPGPVVPGTARNLNFARQWPRQLYRSSGLRDHLRTTPYACVHSHACWILTVRYALAAAEAHRVPLVLSPRGMLTEWAYRHHRGRKVLANYLIHPGAFSRATGWHVTSPEEADDVRRLGFTQPVCVAPNGVVLPDEAALAGARRAWQPMLAAAGPRRIALFYSRFHRKKRLRELLDLWLAAPRDGWYLLLAGLPEEFSTEEVKGWVTTAGAQDRVGVISGAGRPPPYAIASLFLLPSHSENFGLVIAEALAAGVPVLTTDTTPWRGLEREQAGWCVAWPDYPAALTAALAQPVAALGTRGSRGRDWVSRDFTWASSARRLLDFYRELRP